MRDDKLISRSKGVRSGMHQSGGFLLILMIFLGLSGACATTGPGRTDKLSNETADSTRLERENAELKVKLDDALSRIVSLSKMVDEHQVKLDFLADKIRTLEGKRGDTNLQQTSPTSARETPKSNDKTSPRVVPSDEQNMESDKQAMSEPVDPNTVYEKGMNEYRQGQYRQAMVTFKEFLTLFENNPRASNAQYWLGESYYSLGDFSNALSAFSMVLQKFPLSGKMQDAMLKKGYCLMVLGRREEASVVFQQVIDQFPTSVAAEKAREKLQELSS